MYEVCTGMFEVCTGMYEVCTGMYEMICNNYTLGEVFRGYRNERNLRTKLQESKKFPAARPITNHRTYLYIPTGMYEICTGMYEVCTGMYRYVRGMHEVCTVHTCCTYFTEIF